MDPRKQFYMNAQANGVRVDGGSPKGQHFKVPPMAVPDAPRYNPIVGQRAHAPYNVAMPHHVPPLRNAYVTNLFANNGNGGQMPMLPNGPPAGNGYTTNPFANIGNVNNLPNFPRYPQYSMAHAQDDFSADSDRTIRPPPKMKLPPEIFRTSKSTYEVIATLQAPTEDPFRMSDGVRLVKHQSGELRVHKRLRITSEAQEARAEAERVALKQVVAAGGHPNINLLHETFSERPAGLYVHLVLEHCDSQSLDVYIKDALQRGIIVPERFCWHVLFQLSSALAMCHFGVRNPLEEQTSKLVNWNTLCHLDIKPANIFLSSKRLPGQDTAPFPTIILGDFGCVVTRRDILEQRISKDGQPFGTQGWFPPENDINEEDGTPTGRYGKPTDIWQAGAVIQVTCWHWEEPKPKLVNKHGVPVGVRYSPELNAVVQKMMTREVIMRPSAIDVAKEVRAQQDARGFI